jgi:hypothetical protein
MMPVRFWLAAAAGVLLALAGPVHATSLYALIDTGELYSSGDDGVTWTPRATLPARDAVGIVAGTGSNDLYLVTRSGSVYRGNIGARNVWTPVGAISASDIAGFTIGSLGSILALTSTGTVYSSSDHGATFTAVAVLTGADWVSLARGPLGRLYALTATGQVAESQNQGASWSTVGVVTTSDAVAIRRFQNNLFVLSKTGEIYRSINHGAAWTAIGALTSSSMGALADTETALLAAAAEGEVASTANGSSWTWVGAVNQLRVVALATDTPMITGVTEEATAPRFVVRAPYPNPSTGAAGALFSFTLPSPDRVRVSLYDLQGRRVATRPEGTYSERQPVTFRWAPRGLPSGTYFVRFETETGLEGSVRWTLVR